MDDAKVNAVLVEVTRRLRVSWSPGEVCVAIFVSALFGVIADRVYLILDGVL